MKPLRVLKVPHSITQVIDALGRTILVYYRPDECSTFPGPQQTSDPEVPKSCRQSVNHFSGQVVGARDIINFLAEDCGFQKVMTVSHVRFTTIVGPIVKLKIDLFNTAGSIRPEYS